MAKSEQDLGIGSCAPWPGCLSSVCLKMCVCVCVCAYAICFPLFEMSHTQYRYCQLHVGQLWHPLLIPFFHLSIFLSIFLSLSLSLCHIYLYKTPKTPPLSSSPASATLRHRHQRLWTHISSRPVLQHCHFHPKNKQRNRKCLCARNPPGCASGCKTLTDTKASECARPLLTSDSRRAPLVGPQMPQQSDMYRPHGVAE
jgi:hypothetical protein